MMSAAQWCDALGDRVGGSLLDVGAAAGDVTETLASLFDPIVAIDTSMPMVRRLRTRGFDAHRIELATADVVAHRYGTVSALNVLDRCPDPLALLARLVESVEPGGTLVVSLPLPYRPCWYQGPIVRRPRSPLPLDGQTWDGDLDALVLVLEQFGLGIERIVRTPYLSGGDRHRSHYELDAAVIVASVAR
jgi:SAM-dependent methyltransferase